MSRKYPEGAPGIQKKLTQYGTGLLDASGNPLRNDRVNSEWQNISLARNFVSPALEDIEYLYNQVEKIENNVIFAFDVAITTVSLVRDIALFLPNFMNAVINYIASILYKALDELMRLGVYSLIVPPDFTETGFLGLPTTSLKIQSAEVYKKFYDLSDPGTPYHRPFPESLTKEVLANGERVKDRYKYYLEDSALAGALNPSGASKSYMDRDWDNIANKFRNLQNPDGWYDAIYLYFSVEFGQGAGTYKQFAEALAKLADLFKFKSLEGVLLEFDSIFRTKRKSIKVLTTERITGISQSSFSNLSQQTSISEKYREVDVKTNKQNWVDPKLEDFRLFPADPFETITQAKKDVLRTKLQEQIDESEALLADLTSNGSEYISLVTERINTNPQYIDLVSRKDDLEDEIYFNTVNTNIQNLLNTTSTNTTNTNFYNTLENIFGNPPDDVDDSFNSPSDFPDTISFVSAIREYYQVYEREVSALGLLGADPALSTNNIDQSEELNRLKARVLSRAGSASSEFSFSLYSSQAERETRLGELLTEIEGIKEVIEDNVKDTIENEYSTAVEKALNEKKSQLNDLDGRSNKGIGDFIDDEKDSAQILVFENYYGNTGRASLLNSHLQKFYNFESDSDVDYIYEFIVGLDSEEFLPKQDYFNPGQFVQIREKTSKGWEYKGGGIIISGEEKVFDDSGRGTWMSANFTDMLGITADIKRMQNEILSFQNMFASNDEFLDDLINFLKDIKKRILEIIAILDNIISIISLLLSIELTGAIWGKYIRDDNYDEMTVGLTDTSNLIIPRSKSEYTPTNLNTVQSWLDKIREIDPEEAVKIADEINILAKKTSPNEDKNRRNTLRDKSTLETVYSERSSIVTAAEALGNDIRTEYVNRRDTVTSLFNAGTTLYLDFTNALFISKEDSAKSEKDNMIADYRQKIYDFLTEYESKLSNEIGLSLVLLSYLPKGLNFYPVRFLAEKIGLFEQTVETNATDVYVNKVGDITDNFPLEELIVDKIRSLMPNYDVNDMEDFLISSSRKQNPSVRIPPQPKSIKVKLEKYLVTTDFTHDVDEVIALRNDNTFAQVTGSNIEIYKNLLQSYLAGAILRPTTNPPYSFTLGNTDNTFNSNYKYLYEFTLSITPKNNALCASDDEVDIEKIQVHAGVYYEADDSTVLHSIGQKAIELNSDGNEIFSFGRLLQKTFKGELYFKQDRVTNIVPYIFIGYSESVSLENFTFSLDNSEIYLYRIA